MSVSKLALKAFEKIDKVILKECENLEPQDLLEFIGMLLAKSASTVRECLTEEAANDVLKIMVGVK